MDAASCLILGMGYIESNALELSNQEAEELLTFGYIQMKNHPKELIITDNFKANALTLEAQSNGIKVRRAPEKYLATFLTEAREFFHQRLS